MAVTAMRTMRRTNRYYVKIPDTEPQRNQSRNVDIRVEVLVRYYVHCADFHENHACSTSLCK